MSMSSGSSTVMVCSLAFRSRWVRASWNTSSSSSGSIFRRMVPFSMRETESRFSTRLASHMESS